MILRAGLNSGLTSKLRKMQSFAADLGLDEGLEKILFRARRALAKHLGLRRFLHCKVWDSPPFSVSSRLEVSGPGDLLDSLKVPQSEAFIITGLG